MRIFNRKYKRPWATLIVTCFMLLLISAVNFKISSLIQWFSKYILSERFSIDDEWVTLSNQLFVRKLAVFYYYEENMVEALVISETTELKRLSCRMMTLNNDSFITEAYLTELASSPQSLLRLYALKCNLDSSKIRLNEILFLFIRNDLTNEETKFPIRIETKSIELKKKEIKSSGKFMLCSKYFNMRTPDYNDFEKWIEFNLKIGFEKIVLFNLSIEHNEQFNGLFKKYKGLIELRNYKEFPYLDSHAHDAVDTFRNNKMKKIDYRLLRIEQIHEHVAINECYMAYRTYYDHIAQFDTDELIVPKMSFEWQRAPNQSLQCGSNVDGKSDLEVYFDRLYEIDKYRDAESLWFDYADVAYNVSSNEIIENLKIKVLDKFKNQTETNMTLKIQLRNSQNELLKHYIITYDLSSHTDFLYTQYLYDLYNKLNTTHFNLPTSRFDTSMLLFNLTSVEFRGKSIHKTKHVRYIGQHFTYTSNRTQIDPQHGYTIHFRNNVKFIHNRFKLSIKNIYIDFNYFECYLDEKRMKSSF